MRRMVVVVGFVWFAVALWAGQAASAGAQTASNPDSAIRGAFPTKLVKSLDSKKLKDGDVVVCETVGVLHSASGLIVPTGSRVIGHITEAKARSKGDSESSLAMVFDKIEVAKGKELPMKGTLQAVGPSLGSSGPDTGAAGGGQMMAGHGGEGTMAPPSSGSVAGPNSGIRPLDNTGTHPILNAESTGVLGIRNLEMSKDSVLTSSGKEVKLDSGSQMLVRAEIQIPVQ